LRLEALSTVDVVLPVYNEAHVLERSVRALHAFLTDHLTHEWRILIADNGSTDGTIDVAKRLEAELPDVAVMRIPEAGRGRALTRAWLASNADVVSYMDIDLSTDLEAFPRLVSLVADQGFDAAAGSRLDRTSETERSLKREVLSRGFVLLISLMFRVQGHQPGVRPASFANGARYGLVLGYGATAPRAQGRLEGGLRTCPLG
jgi:glycosyltransferase involved in cell wall biosynthesis